MSTIHELADVAPCQIGEGTRVWQFVVILEGASIGKNSNICAHTLIEGDVVIGDDVTIKSGVQVWNGTRIESNVFIGPNATFTNDPYPRSKEYPQEFSGITIKHHASIGANATLLPGITIGEYAMIGAGAVVTENVPAKAVVVGNPAKIIRYIDQ
ncbi:MULTISPECIES: acyltransferase [Pseudomonas]|uniref:acyltransferase n=1 Tax=Pseudomonas TaxID=286 RepID=UPI0009F4093D|nr:MULTISPECIES: acyltransferase [Pseudomonas]